MKNIFQTDGVPTSLNSSQEIPSEIPDTNSLLTEPIWWREENFDKINLILIGFSKGCVVLNQVIVFISNT